MSKTKELYEFSNREIISAIEALDKKLVEWKEEIGLCFASDPVSEMANPGNDICAPVKKAILDQWLKARETETEENW